MYFRKGILSLLIMVLSPIHPGQASEVKLSHMGLNLNANFELSTNTKHENEVILITHSGLAHNGLEIITYLQAKLKGLGYNTLAINLSLGLDNRHGMYDCKTTHRHLFSDAENEISAWMGWLKENGVKRVVVLGHSRGASQTALYAAEQDNSLIQAVILLAPDTQATNDMAAYQKRHGVPLEGVLTLARKFRMAGKGSTVLEHTGLLYCMDTSVAADTLLSYYDEDPRLDTPYLIPKISKPTLVVIAGNDEFVVGANTKFSSLSSAKNIQMKTIEGADHFFRDLYADDVVEVVNEFLMNLRK